MWFVFAIFSAIFAAIYYAVSKKLLKSIDQYVFTSGIYLTASVILLSISILKGIPALGAGFYHFVLISWVLNATALFFLFRAFRIGDLSLTVPMISITPLFLIFTSFLLLNELPSLTGMFGIFLIVIGSYILNMSKEKKHLLDPFKSIFRNRSIFYMLIVAFLLSIVANLDKIVVLNSDPFFGASIISLLLGSSFLVIAAAKKREVKRIYKDNFHKFLFVGIIIAMIIISVNIAFTMQIVPYVISLKRLSILFSVFLGGLLFKEKDILRRGVGASIMLAGLVLIIAL